MEPTSEPARRQDAATYLTVAGIGTLLAFGAGYLDFAWPFDLATHFRVQQAVLLVVFALALGVVRRYVLAITCVAAGALAFGSIASYAFAREATQTPADMRLLSYNVWFRTTGEEQAIARFLEASAADVLVLQELSVARAQRLATLLPSYPHAYFAAAHPHGAAIFSRWPMVASSHVELGQGGSRATQVKIQWRGREVGVIGVHLHWPLSPATFRLRGRELTAVAALARNHSGPLLITGDFNTTTWSRHFRAVVAASGLQDCARGFGLNTTWPAQFPPLAIRIDHCLVSAEWHTVAVHTGPRLGSDHVATIADLAFRPSD